MLRPTPVDASSDPVPAGGPARPAEARAPPADRLVQDPGRLQPHLPAAGGLRGGGRLGRQPRPGRGPGRRAHRPRGDDLHAGQRAPAQGRGDQGLRRRRRPRRATWSTTASHAAQQFAADTGAVFVPPFDDPAIIAGQGTVGLELADEAPDAEVVVVPVGGGGLISGVATALAHTRPRRQGDRRRGGGGGVDAGRARRRPVRSPLDRIDDHGRRHRRAVACPRSRSPTSRRSSTTSSRDRGGDQPGRRCCCSSGPRRWSSRPAPSALAALLAGKVPGAGAGGGRAVGRQRRPAPADEAHRPRPVRRRAATCCCGSCSATGPARWPRSPGALAEHGPQRARGRAPPLRAATSASTRSRCWSRSRPATPSTATTSSPVFRRRGSPSSSCGRPRAEHSVKPPMPIGANG